MNQTKYKTFTRSCNSFEEMARANKRTVDRNLTIEEARRQCTEFNDHRTPTQVRRGTKMEFTAQ